MAGFNIGGLIQQAANDMQGQAYNDFTTRVLSQLPSIDAWLNRANEYINKNNSLSLTVGAMNALTEIQERNIAYDNLENAYLEVLNEAQEVEGAKLIAEGYKLMNHIGETLRGDQIIYSVTIPYDGTYITWNGTMDEFIGKWNGSQYTGMVNFSKRRMYLKSTKNLLTKYNEQYPTWTKWGKDKTDAFESFINRIRYSGQFDQWKKVNKGNMLEAFSRIYSQNKDISYKDIDAGYLDYLITDVMKETLQNTDPFWSGGDIGAEQLKGANASVTNVSQLIYQLNDTRNMMQSILLKSPSGDAKVPNVANVTASVEKKLQEDIEILIRQFLGKFGA